MRKIINKKTNIFLYFFLILAFFMYVAAWSGGLKLSRGDFPRLSVGGKIFSVEIADSDKTRQKGLGERESLCRDCGMLFVFPERARTSFWMKDMRFDLDIIWIADGKVLHIEKKVSRGDKKIFNPEVLADSVLEVNSGVSSDLGIKEGDRVEILD